MKQECLCGEEMPKPESKEDSYSCKCGNSYGANSQKDWTLDGSAGYRVGGW